MSEPTRNRAAVVLFVDSETVTGPDIANVLRHALYKNGTLHDGLNAVAGGVEHHIRIVDVMDAGIAAGNGYLWTEATPKSWKYHEHSLGDKGLLRP
jgi:hypothetical protein